MIDSSRPIFVGLGEILWDMFPDGPRFGGAPANFVCHAASMGANSWMVSGVGQDELGRAAINALNEHQVSTRCVVQSASRPTGRVTIQIDGEGKPDYRFGMDEAWDHIAWTSDAETLAHSADVVCFGTLGQRHPIAKETIQRFVESAPQHCLKVFDINLREYYFDRETIHRSLELANVLKLNDEELPLLMSIYELNGSEVEAMRGLAERFELGLVALTRGSLGAVLVRGDEVSTEPSVPTEIVDTVGAGDAFTASLTLGLLREDDLTKINQRASRVAAFVCSQPGATPSLPSNFTHKLFGND